MSVHGLRRIAEVLESVLTEFGRRTADDPRRLKGLLTDSFGAEAPEHQDAIDAVVGAAEAGVPAAALEDATDRLALADMLVMEDRDEAAEVVEVWISALHIQDRVPTDGATAVPPPAHFDPGATELPPKGVGGVDETKSMEPLTQPATGPTGPTLMERVGSFLTERRGLVLAVAGILVLLVGTVALGSMWTGGGSTTTTAVLAGETTTTAGDTTTTLAERVTVLEHEEEVTSWGASVNRTWRIDGDLLVLKLMVSSDEEPIDGSVWELFPSSMEADASAIGFTTSDILTQVHANELAARLILALPANTEWSYEYSVPLPSGATTDPLYLENLHAEWETAMTEFRATPAPKLEVTSSTPADGQVKVTGSTDPGIEVQVNGKPIEVAADGTFETSIPLEIGDNVVTIRAVNNVRGNATPEEFVWAWNPVVVQNSTTTTKPSTGTTKPTTSTTTPTTTTPTTAPPSNKAPTAECGTQNTYIPEYDTSYWLTLETYCFADSDGTVVTAFATNPDYGSISTGSTNCSGSVWCWTYSPPSSWDGQARWIFFHVRVQDDDGAYSPYIQWNVCINCLAP